MMYRKSADTNSEIVSIITGSLYPFILLFGCYIIINGHVSPGGGFQGGAVLAAVFMSRYLSLPLLDIDVALLQTLEKVLFICIAIVPILFIFTQWQINNPFLHSIYFMLMNSLIGLKVCCGIAIIFFRFAFYEAKR